MAKKTMTKESVEELKEILDFGKYGFKGTLYTVISGLILIFALATLSAFTEFEISGWELVVLAFIILTGAISFGCLSLRKLPDISINLLDGDLSITTKAEKNGKR